MPTRCVRPLKTIYLRDTAPQEAGHRVMLKHLGLEPILDLGMRLGEGTGAALAMGIMDGAVRMFKEVLTFQEAGVANK